MGNMREISIAECNAVFGGTDEPQEAEIVVTATKKVNSVTSTDGFGGFSFGGLGDFSLPDGWSLGLVDGLYSNDGQPLVDANGDGYYDNAQIVVIGATQDNPELRYLDLGGGYWGLIGGITGASNGDLGLFGGLGLPGLQLGTGTATDGQLPDGWDFSSPPSVIYRSGAIPIAGSEPVGPEPVREGHYRVEGWGPFGYSDYPIPGYQPVP